MENIYKSSLRILQLFAAFLLAAVSASANPASGGYQLFGGATSAHQADIQLTSLENFNHQAKIASECCNDPKRIAVPDSLRTNIHSGAQDKHIPGTNNYDPTRSTLTANPQTLLDDVHSGQYPIVREIPRGNTTSYIVDFGSPIGDFKSNGSLIGPTQFGQVVQGKNGVHIIPANPNQF